MEKHPDGPRISLFKKTNFPFRFLPGELLQWSTDSGKLGVLGGTEPKKCCNSNGWAEILRENKEKFHVKMRPVEMFQGPSIFKSGVVVWRC